MLSRDVRLINVQPNQALPEGIPLGQADGMSWVRNSWLMVV